MAARPTVTAHSGSRILAGTLFTAEKTMRRVIVTSLDAGLTIEPMEHETHSTSFVSRAAVVSKADLPAIAKLGLRADEPVNRQRELIQPHLASPDAEDALLLIVCE